MTKVSALILGAVLAACAAFQPGSGVTPEAARAWGCDPVAVESRAEVLRASLPEGKRYIPQVGWDACELLARNGAPTKVELQQTTDSRGASWWYQTQDETHLVSLELTGPQWVVVYVGW